MNKTIIICLWILFLCTNILQAKIYNVKDFGAVGDGQHIDSEAINQAKKENHKINFSLHNLGPNLLVAA